jgi:hypothetical protein
MPMQSMAGVPGTLFQKWLHSFEEDAGDVRVYRPERFSFPRARGRAGIEFRPDGTFVEWRIGRGDAPTAVEGRWQLESATRVRVTPAPSSAGGSSPVLEIVECTDQILKVRWR